MKLYIISFNRVDYDEYDSFVVVANNEDEVVLSLVTGNNYSIDWKGGYKISEINLSEITEPTILLGSFNAG